MVASDKTKVNAAIEQLKRLGYEYNDDAQSIIELCDLWYTNQETDFHTRKNLNDVEIKLDSLNFAKRCCADDANLCEIVEINAGENENKFDGVQEILDDNRFDVMYRKQLERLSAAGTVGAYLRLEGAELLENGHARGGKIRINYVNASGIVPLTVDNDDVISLFPEDGCGVRADISGAAGDKYSHFKLSFLSYICQVIYSRRSVSGPVLFLRPSPRGRWGCSEPIRRSRSTP